MNERDVVIRHSPLSNTNTDSVNIPGISPERGAPAEKIYDENVMKLVTCSPRNCVNQSQDTSIYLVWFHARLTMQSWQLILNQMLKKILTEFPMKANPRNLHLVDKWRFHLVICEGRKQNENDQNLRSSQTQTCRLYNQVSVHSQTG